LVVSNWTENIIHIIIFAMLLPLIAALALGHPVPATTYSGRDEHIHVKIPRLEVVDGVKVDGVLDEPVWQQAALLNGFSQFSPQDGIPAQDSTQVLVWYDRFAIHFGIRAFEAHGAVHATLADRDKILADDNIQIFLGTFNDRRQAMVFGVNPLGVQLDGTMVERGQVVSNGWNGSVAARGNADLNQDFVFESKGHLTSYGYEVEIRIPFRSLRYQSADVQNWDLNIVRDIQHSGYEDSWAPAKRSSPSFLGQSGSLDGLHDMSRGLLVVDMNPVVTEKLVGTPAPSGWGYANATPQVGGTARWGITNNLSLSGTANPDFAEIESDAGKILLDPRLSLYYPEKRPFFLDGAEQFGVPSGLIYTRRIVQPEGAVKLSGKADGITLGLLAALDDPLPGAPTQERARFGILRMQRDLGEGSRIGVAYTDRELPGDLNRVADVDGRILLGGPYSAQLQYAESWSQKGGTSLDGELWGAVLNRSGKNFGARYTFSGTSPDFRTTSGFISRLGVTNLVADQHYTWFMPREALLDNVAVDVQGSNTWASANLAQHGDAIEKKLHLSLSSTLRGGWGVGGGVYWETFGYDPVLYAGYQVERTIGSVVDTVAFAPTPRIFNRDYVFTFNTPRFKWFNLSAVYIGGQDENFFEWAQADIHYVSAQLSVRPTDQVRVDATYDYQDYYRRTDGTRVGKTLIPRLKLEYQLSRAVFLRVVGEEDVATNDDLRDNSSTQFPLIIGGQRALAARSDSFHGDFLFSYTPTPGTVLFLGYGGEALATPDVDPRNRFNASPLVRSQDHFFVKYSYLFHL
jgi:Domain of unknown function (DUF5916)